MSQTLLSVDYDRRVLRCWHEWQIDGRVRQIILCVETDLELRPDQAGFNRQEVEDLIDHATHLMRASAAPVDAIRIIPAQ